MTNPINPVSRKRIDAAIQTMNEVMEHSRRINPFQINETLYAAVRYLESYNEAKKGGKS